MWYTKKDGRKKLDMSLPIFAKTEDHTKIYILLPQIDATHHRYGIIGYNWMDIKTGDYNSCCTWLTVEEAVKAYKHGHEIYNGHLIVNITE